MCVQGHQTRRRLCNNPPPRCGGHACGGMVAKEERQCFVCPSKLLLLALSYENHGQLTISFRTIYQYGRKTEDPKLPPYAPCIPRSCTIFCFLPLFQRDFLLFLPLATILELPLPTPRILPSPYFPYSPHYDKRLLALCEEIVTWAGQDGWTRLMPNTLIHGLGTSEFSYQRIIIISVNMRLPLILAKVRQETCPLKLLLFSN